MTDRWLLRIVALGLALVALTTVTGGIMLAAGNHQLPDALVAVGSGSAGALAALLARTTGGTGG